MKKTFFLFLVLFSAFQWAQGQNTNMTNFGTSFEPKNVIEVSQLPAMLASQTEVNDLTLQGTIIKTCKKKGCWMTIQMGNNQELMVKFKDYGFFVPLDDDGKKTIIHGVAKMEVVSVEKLRHLAEDAGKSKEEIEKITQSETKYTFIADGVWIENSTAANKK